jgi:hypothetical protein
MRMKEEANVMFASLAIRVSPVPNCSIHETITNIAATNTGWNETVDDGNLRTCSQLISNIHIHLFQSMQMKCRCLHDAHKTIVIDLAV